MEFINYAHRGASAYAPENTQSSFKLGMEMGANGVETDVRLTKDNVPVLFHDKTLKRMADRPDLTVEGSTYEELLEFNFIKNGTTDKIMKFEDFLGEFSNENIYFAIELKGENVEKITADLLRKYEMQNKTTVTSANYEELKRFRKYAPEFKTGYLTDEVDEKLLLDMKQNGITELCPVVDIIDSEKVKSWKELGFSVRTWGIKDTNLMEYAVNCGVDGMTVNFPDKLKSFLISR